MGLPSRRRHPRVVIVPYVARGPRRVGRPAARLLARGRPPPRLARMRSTGCMDARRTNGSTRSTGVAIFFVRAWLDLQTVAEAALPGVK